MKLGVLRIALVTAITVSLTMSCALASRSVVPRMAPALTIVVDTGGEGGPNAHVYRPIAGVVTLVEGHGRFDVTANAGGPSVAVGGVRVDRPLGAAGDYYLFDSTSYTLVHPATKTFARVAIRDDSYNFVENREGWPEFFEFRVLPVDTLAAAGPRSGLAEHGEAGIFWHLDIVRTGSPIQILARGRFRIPDIPAGEVSVARWFGAAQALASIPRSYQAVQGEHLQVTSVTVLHPFGAAPAINLVTLSPFSRITTSQVDLSRLNLPTGYQEIPWPPK